MEVSLARNLWHGCRREAMFALYHPFVTSLASGRLKLGAFQRYLAQDAFFLRTFAEAYGLAMENTHDREAKKAISSLQQAAYEELHLHSSLAKKWDIDMQKLGTPNAATSNYTQFLLKVASGKAEQYGAMHKENMAAMTIGAMVPCMRLYAFLGQKIQEAVEVVPSDHLYRDWISTYASTDFESSATQIENVLNKLSSVLEAEEDVQTLKRLYHRAMMLEVDFFDAQSFDQCLNVPVLKSAGLKNQRVFIVSDFDSTCTIADSCPVLAELGIGNDESRKRGIWNKLSESYFREYKLLLENVLTSRKDGTYDYETVQQAMQTLSTFEKQGNENVVTTGVLSGIKMEDIKQAAHNMPLQDGCAEFFHRLATEHESISCHIVSVCWSKTFIDEVLSQGCIKNVDIHSNELSNDGYRTDGGLTRHIETPLDKVTVLHEKILSSGRDENFVVYVGDSLTDLPCLLQADLGIVLGESSSLQRAALAFGVKMVPLYKGLLVKERTSNCWNGKDGVLYTASGWSEIEASILGCLTSK